MVKSEWQFALYPFIQAFAPPSYGEAFDAVSWLGERYDVDENPIRARNIKLAVQQTIFTFFGESNLMSAFSDCITLCVPVMAQLESPTFRDQPQ